MPDWKQLVAERLAHIKLTPDVRRDVVAEIAAHLEECHRELVAGGSFDPERQTLAQVPDWNALCRRIRRAKEDRMNVVRRVLMPGLAAVVVVLAALRLFVYLLIAPEPCGPDATCISITADGPAFLPWLATLPLAGALGAVLARSMGARPVQRLIAAVSPALFLGAETMVMGLLDGFFWRIPIYWVVIPAIACAIGALPFLGGRRDPIDARSVAVTRDKAQGTSTTERGSHSTLLASGPFLRPLR